MCKLFIILCIVALGSCKEQYYDKYEVTYYDGTKDSFAIVYKSFFKFKPDLDKGDFYVRNTVYGSYVRSYRHLK